MSAMRYLLLALSIPLLSACDPEVKPAKVVPPGSTTPTQQHAPAPEPPPVVVPAQAAREESDSLSQAQPSASAAQAPAPPVVPPVAAPKVPAAVEPEQPSPSLDLSLPPELLEQASVQEDGGSGRAPLLPPLFEEKPATDGPFQLSGRLINEDRGADDWSSVEGAELQFEFKR
ncbi:hypothetical protein SBP02_12535 [Pseudomonas benzenivorans]|uniref:Translation initiation factor 2 n=1 Tax=Pseudomonas benzenivorans TaxID=556533 RepID=A0ABZ0PSE0_9PSED|nr:hypothetical protein [Pseudomonas benzenivorans]WPC03607.1 hypothetical protein SBP02_12535 [Pseudomonas benzenivorans]